eukprot:TRINITY_DN29335_c2_g1_i4.p3 TRINITY_DN29335_c2_g1~~TRINITY_DN29335_c2_g1_i4.p3  ORF type:complete len:139 (+),score=16.15 TRINITY_DN29335_c2_g1_i4:68-484(+)
MMQQFCSVFVVVVCLLHVNCNSFEVSRGLKQSKPEFESQGGGQGVALKKGQRPIVQVEQCVVKKDANSGICPQTMKTVCGIESKQEFKNCCFAVDAGETQIYRGPCTLPTRNGKRRERKQGSMRMGSVGGGGDFYSQY